MRIVNVTVLALALTPASVLAQTSMSPGYTTGQPSVMSSQPGYTTRQVPPQAPSQITGTRGYQTQFPTLPSAVVPITPDQVYRFNAPVPLR